LTPLVGPSGSQLWPRDQAIPFLYPSRAFISTSNKYPEATVRWIDIWMDGTDWGYSAMEGQKDINWGTNEEGYVYSFDPPEGTTRAEHRSRISYDSGANYWNSIAQPQSPQYGWITQYEMVQKLSPYYDIDGRFPKEYFPLLEEEEIITRYWPGILLYINENMARFITGDLDIDSNWDKYIKGFSALGTEKVIDSYQARYERFVKVAK
jgi:putative aldouronate transport system substrate-binding protein